MRGFSAHCFDFATDLLAAFHAQFDALAHLSFEHGGGGVARLKADFAIGKSGGGEGGEQGDEAEGFHGVGGEADGRLSSHLPRR